MTDIKLPEHCIGSKFRPCTYHEITPTGAVLVGWGLEEKPSGKRRYEPRGFRGELHPFKTEEEANAVCSALNAQSAITRAAASIGRGEG